VVLRDDLTADEAATRSLRDQLARERGEPKMFDFGGTVAELKERCVEDTRLQPPKSPVFQKWMQTAAMQAAQ
jgi:N-methylhydantoinase B